jgi:hypothetical protein
MRKTRGMGYGQSTVIALVLGTTCRWRERRYFPRLRADTPASPDTTPVSAESTAGNAVPVDAKRTAGLGGLIRDPARRSPWRQANSAQLHEPTGVSAGSTTVVIAAVEKPRALTIRS